MSVFRMKHSGVLKAYYTKKRMELCSFSVFSDNMKSTGEYKLIFVIIFELDVM